MGRYENPVKQAARLSLCFTVNMSSYDGTASPA